MLNGMPIDNANNASKGTRGMCLGQPGSTGITDAKAGMEQGPSVLIQDRALTVSKER